MSDTNLLHDVRARHPMTRGLTAALVVGGLLWLFAFTWMFSTTFLFSTKSLHDIAAASGPSDGLIVKMGAVVVMGLLGPAVLLLAWWRHHLWVPAMWRPVRSR